MKNRKLKTIFTHAIILIFFSICLFFRQAGIVKAQSPTAADPKPTPVKPGSGPVNPMIDNFANETVGAAPVSFAPAVGNWIIGIDQGNKVLVVDGSRWRQGQASAGLADKARALYGERYAEFLDNVKAYAYYPFAVSQSVKNFTDGRITVRFKAIAGRIDQGAGILFDLKNNGDYYAIRANPLENNLVLWRFKNGHRSSVSWVRNVPTASRKWHDLEVVIDKNIIKGYVNDRHYLTCKLPEAISGKVGLWTKADSVIYFDDYTVIAK